MTRKLLFFCFVLSLISTLPAHASPTDKKITIICSSGSPDVIIGQVVVTLYDSTGISNICGSLSCDSSGGAVLPGVPATNSASCTPGFRVSGMRYSLNYTDYSSINPLTLIASGSVTTTEMILKASGFSTQVGPTGYPGDTVTLNVK